MHNIKKIHVLILASALSSVLVGCSSSPFSSNAPKQSVGSSSAEASAGGGNVLSNLFFYGGTTVPPVAKSTEDEDYVCPPLDIADGGAALRLGAAESNSVRQQITLNQIARECNVSGGVLRLKAGAQGLVLLGPAGSVGTTSVNVKFVALRDDKVISSNVQRVAVTIPSGKTQASFVVVSSEMIIPAPTEGVKIEVSLDVAAGAAQAKRKRR